MLRSIEMPDLEASIDPKYQKFESPCPSTRSRSPRTRQMRYLYLRICFLIIAFLFMFSTIEHLCNTSLFAQGLLTYVSFGEIFSSGPSPLREQPQFKPWELTMSVDGIDEEMALIVTAADAGTHPSESFIRQQEDVAGVDQLRELIADRAVNYNNTIIFVPVKSTNIQWVVNINCRFSYIKQSNVVYWAMDQEAATQLESKGYRFFYNPLLQVRDESNRAVEQAKHNIRLWKWVMHTGVNLLYIEPTVAIFHDPMETLQMDADIEAIINEASVDAATTLTKSRIPKLGTGVIWFKATAQMITFFDNLTAQLDTGKFTDETDVLNAVLRSRPQQYTIANTIDNNPEAHFQPTTDTPETQVNTLSYRYVSPFYFVNHPIFETDMHLHTSGYMSAFSLRDSNWDNDRFYPTLLYVHASDLEKYEVARRDEGVQPQESRMVERWRSLGWWELNEEGKCSFIASMPHTSYMA